MDIIKMPNNIYYIKNLIENPKEIIKTIESTNSSLNSNTIISPWHGWGGTYLNEDAEDKTSYKTDPKSIGSQKTKNKKWDKVQNEEDEKCLEVVKIIENALEDATKYYCKENNLKHTFRFSPLTISKYNQHGGMGTHVDSDSDFNKSASAIIYLNDEYEGGEVVFDNFGISLKPEAGSILMFPSHTPYEHTVKAIKSGHKYMCSFVYLVEDL